MAKYFAGTRLALHGKSSPSVIWQSTIGSPQRFDSDYVNGCIQLPPATTGGGQVYSSITLPIGIDAISAPSVFIKFEWLGGATSAPSAYGLSWPWVEFLDSSVNTIARICAVAPNGGVDTRQYAEYWNGSGFTSIGGLILNPSAESRTEYQFKLIGGASGGFQFWRGAALELNSGIIPLNRTGNICYVRISNPILAASYLSQIAISDFDMRGYKFPSDTITSSGTFNEGTGNATDTGDFDLNTAKALPGNLNKYSGNTNTRTLPGNLAIESVTVGSIMRAGGSVANARSIMVVGGTSYSGASNIIPAPISGYEWRGQDWATHPTLGAWTNSSYNSTEKGHEART